MKLRQGPLLALLAVQSCAHPTVQKEREPTPMQKMPFDAKGSGRPLVLVGGGLTGYASWIPHQERLAATRRVVRVQPLAVQFGLDERALPETYSVKMESGALAATIEALGAEGPVDVVAWSYGAAITLEYALDNPSRIRTLTLIEPPAFWTLDATGSWDAESRKESEDLRALYAEMKARGTVSEDDLATFVRAVAICPPDKNPRELPGWPAWLKHRRSLLSGDAPWGVHDTKDRLTAFDRPVLLVKGTGSSHFLHRIIDALAQTMPRSEVVELPGGHAPQIVAMDAFLSRLSTFEERGGTVSLGAK
jgi:pimeloyl-ACP methyl ester carboxylesterase